MKTSTPTPPITQILRERLESRCSKNPRYSLRAFARDLGISASQLSRVMNGQKGISKKMAEQFAQLMGLSSSEAEAFVTMTESQFARSKKDKRNAQEKLKSHVSYKDLSVDAFKVISDWYHLAILSLTETAGFENDEKWIAKRLGLSIHEVKGAIERLKSLEMIEENNGSLKSTGLFFANPAGIPSQSVRQYHHQILDKAKEAVDLQTTQERDYSSHILAVKKERLVEARESIKKFRDEFEKTFCENEISKNEVYALNVQFFKLTQGETLK